MTNHPKFTGEGSTKPTYSELEAENLRVRGLLQRIGVSCIQFTDAEATAKLAEVCRLVLAELAIQGAESADIGKLETADKSGKVNRVEDDLQIVRVLRACGKNMNGGQFENFVTHIVIPLVEHHWLAGSAETGGEKAAPENVFFSPTSQSRKSRQSRALSR